MLLKVTQYTVYWKIFASLYFHKFYKFCLVAKKFMKVLPCHTFYVAHVDHSREYIL